MFPKQKPEAFKNTLKTKQLNDLQHQIDNELSN